MNLFYRQLAALLTLLAILSGGGNTGVFAAPVCEEMPEVVSAAAPAHCPMMAEAQKQAAAQEKKSAQVPPCCLTESETGRAPESGAANISRPLSECCQIRSAAGPVDTAVLAPTFTPSILTPEVSPLLGIAPQFRPDAAPFCALHSVPALRGPPPSARIPRAPPAFS